MIKIQTEETPVFKRRGLKVGKITCEGVGPIANGLRRILLDEIECIAFDTSLANMSTTDTLITHDILRAITFVKVYEENIGKEYFINVVNKTDDIISVFSDSIMDMKTEGPANVKKNVEICVLRPNCKLTIRGIRLEKGIGRTNAKFSSVTGTVAFEPTDVFNVRYLNERGFIENDLRPILKKNFKEYKKGVNYIVWNDDWAKSLNKHDLEYANKFTKIKYTGEYFSELLNFNNDFIIEFKAENPEVVFKKAMNVLKESISKSVLTITAGEILRHFCWLEEQCSIVCDYNEAKNISVLSIMHKDGEQILENAKKKVLKIIT